MRRFATVACVLLALCSSSFAAERVGFRRLTVTDSSRPGVSSEWRTIEAFVWYPAAGGGESMTRVDYFVDDSETESRIERGRDALRSRLQSMIEEDLSDAKLDSVLAEELEILEDAEPSSGPFPIVFVSDGLRSPLYTLSSLCERIAATGYFVVAIDTPPLEAGSRMGFNQISLETMMRDIETTLGSLATDEHVDLSRVGLVGWSAGSIANILLQMRNPLFDAVVSLDGGVGYDYGAALARESIWFRSDALDAPLLDIRALATTGVERDFGVLELARTETSWRVEIDTLTHAEMTTTFGELAPGVSSFTTDDVAREIAADAVALFLDHALRDDVDAANLLDELGEGNDDVRVSRVKGDQAASAQQ